MEDGCGFEPTAGDTPALLMLHPAIFLVAGYIFASTYEGGSASAPTEDEDGGGFEITAGGDAGPIQITPLSL